MGPASPRPRGLLAGALRRERDLPISDAAPPEGAAGPLSAGPLLSQGTGAGWPAAWLTTCRWSSMPTWPDRRPFSRVRRASRPVQSRGRFRFRRDQPGAEGPRVGREP